VSDEATPKDALEVLNEIRVQDFAGISEDLLEEMFEIETAAQFESDRGPTVAKLRDLITGEDQA
jgi:hypothetical protein